MRKVAMRWGHKAIFCHFLRGEKRERRDLQSVPAQTSNVEANLLRFQKQVLRPQSRKKTDSMIHKRIRERIRNTFRIIRHCPLSHLLLQGSQEMDSIFLFLASPGLSMGMALVSESSGCEKDSMKKKWKCSSLSCVQLCHPTDCSPPGSSVQGIL